MNAPTTRETADHAELARIEALLREHIRVDASGLAPAVVSHFVFGFDTAASALLSEIAALRGEQDAWRETVRFNERCWSEERGVMIDRFAQAERQRDEAVGLLRKFNEAWRSGCGWLPAMNSLDDEIAAFLVGMEK